MTTTIPAERDRKDLLPSEHIVDTGSLDAQLLVESQRDDQRDLVGSTRQDSHWQARQQNGSDAAHVLIDWQHQQATCPQEHTSIRWTLAGGKRKNEVVTITFSTNDCQACPARSLCIPSSRLPRRPLTVRPEARSLALKQRREPEKTRDFPAIYHKRAGIEGTISQGVRTMGVRRSRSIGLEKTYLQHAATAAALHLVRSLAWFEGLPRAQTRCSHSARLSDAA